MSDVARDSRVSPATLFNYFPNKGALAEAWVRGELVDRLADALRELGEHSVRSTLRRFCREFAGTISRDRAVRLEAWGEAGRARRKPIDSGHPLIAGLAREQERERIRKDLSAESLGEILLDAIEGAVMAGLRAAEDESELAKTLRARVDLVLDGARKKNERIDPARATSGSDVSGRR